MAGSAMVCVNCKVGVFRNSAGRWRHVGTQKMFCQPGQPAYAQPEGDERRDVIVDLRDAINDGKLGAFSGRHVEVYLNDHDDTGTNWFRMLIDGEPWRVTLVKEAQ